MLSAQFYDFLSELKNNNIIYNTDAAIKESEVYEIMSEIGINFSDLNKEKLKYNRKKIEGFKNKKKKDTIAADEIKEMKLLSREELAHRVLPNFDNVFELLFLISNENR